MVLEAMHGSPRFPTTANGGTPSTQADMQTALQALQAHKDAWVALTIRERIALLDRLSADFSALAPRWVAACLRAKGVAADSLASGEEWLAGPWPVLKNMRQLRRALLDIEQCGHPRIAGAVCTRPDGQVVARVFPQTVYDRIFFAGISGEVWMEPGVTSEELPVTQAVAYQRQEHSGKVALVLGAGNVSSIGPMDILYKLFVEDQVVIFKSNPVNAYLDPLLTEGFRALIEPGFLAVSHGGAAQGAYLCNHPGVDEIHITGSDKTYDAVVFGTGEAGAARKRAAAPLLKKRVTGELGNVSPIIIVPGPWGSADIAYQAEHIVSTLTNNAGFNCNATRVIVNAAGWEQRALLLQHIRGLLECVPTRRAFYPGAHARQRAFVAAHSEGSEQIGSYSEGELPWTLIKGVNSQGADEICFTSEAFCALFAETTLAASSVAEYIERAVAFANERLWGSLNATLLVHPRSLKDPAVAAAVERAVAGLRYGAIGVNYWAGTAFALGVTTWGAYPGHTIDAIQSGCGVVHNTLMFSRAQKSVLRAPFRSTPKPPWFVTRGQTALNVFPRLVAFEAAPSPLKVPAIVWSAITG
jgi:acyl-CoA reductase-like NAD-dependent aldehyde dehydrogenase